MLISVNYFKVLKNDIQEIQTANGDRLFYTPINELGKELGLQRLYKHCNLKNEQIIKSAVGKPSVKDSPNYISISHSKKSAAIVLSTKKIGLDIEEFRPQLLRIQHKFVGPSEEICLNNLELLTWLWTCKEAIFKIFGSNLPFIEGIKCESVPDNIESNAEFSITHSSNFMCKTESRLSTNGEIITTARII